MVRAVVFIGTILMACGSSPGFAQSETDEASIVSNGFYYAVNHLVEDQRMLYNGTEFYPYEAAGSGHPFFISDGLSDERIKFNGINYEGIQLAYDLFMDRVIIEAPSGGVRICPVKERIDEFTLSGHLFKYLKNTPGLEPGFYDCLFENSTSLYASRRKNRLGFKWKEHVKFYVVHPDNRVFVVSDKKTLLAALPDKQKEVLNFIQEKRIRFGKDREKSFVRVIGFYATLNN